MKKEGHFQVETVRRGIEAASFLLRLATCPHVDQRIVHEDALNATISLFRSHLTQHIIPSWNQKGAYPPVSFSTSPSTTTGVSPKKRRRSSPTTAVTANSSNKLTQGSGVAGNEWKKVYKVVLSTLPSFLVLMERLHAVVRASIATSSTGRVTLDDQPLLMLTDASIASFEMDCAVASSYHSPSNTTSLGIPAALGPQVQIASMDLVTAAFAYVPHRETILEDILGILLKLPSGKRSLRAFEVRYSSTPSGQALSRRNARWVGTLLAKTCPLEARQPHRIQMITALIIHVLQAVVVRPVYESSQPKVDSDDEDGEVSRRHDRVLLRSGLVQSQSVAEYLAAAILQRCSRKEASGAASEFRPILSNMVDDLLVVLIIPEYPAAELMLTAIVRRIIQDLQKSSQYKTHNIETTYLNLCFDILGKVSAVQAKLLAFNRDHPVDMKIAPLLPSENNALVFGCYCKSSHEAPLVIRCNECQLYSHDLCVGINYERVPDEWLCDACRLGRIATRERAKLGDSQDIPAIIDEIYAMRQSYLATLSHRNGIVGLESAIAFHLARWADELESKNGERSTAITRALVHGILDCWEGGLNATKVGETLTEEGEVRVIVALLTQTTSLFLSFRNQMVFLISLLNDSAAPMLRKLAVKAIERAVEGDNQLMLLPIITKAVSRLLTDDTISVREAAVSLVGSYVVHFAAVTKAYHTSLLKCLSDVGISVRKRAVKIFLEILQANPRYRSRADVFGILLQRAADKKEEESVRNLIHDMLAKLWLENGEDILGHQKPAPSSRSFGGALNKALSGPPSSPSEVHQEAFGTASPGIVTPTRLGSKDHGPAPLQRRADVTAQQMVEVVRSGGSSANLEALLRTLLTASSDSNARKIWKPVDTSQCDKLVDSLFEHLLTIEEQNADRRSTLGKDLVAVLQTISIFSGSYPKSVYRHLSTILPFLKADNGVTMEDETLVVSAACDILSNVSTIFDRNDIERLSESSVAKDLQMITYKFGACALSAAVRALSCLAHHRHAVEAGGFAKKLLGMAQTFYSYLVKQRCTKDFSEASDKVRHNTQRALSTLGLVCQYHTRSAGGKEYVSDSEDENGEQQEAELLDGKKLNWLNMNRACFKLFTIFCEKQDCSTKCVSLRALSGIFMVEPRLMLELEKEGFIKTILEPDADNKLQLEALKSFRSILINEEKRVDGGYAKKKMEQDKAITVSKKISGDQDGDSNIFGGVLTSYAESIFRLTKISHSAVRFAAGKHLYESN